MKRFFIIGFIAVSCAIAGIALEVRLNAICIDTIVISLDSVNFGSRPMFSSSDGQPVEIENPVGGCGVPLTGVSLSITGTDADQFRIKSTDCGSTLADGALCNATIVFSPKTTGDFTDATFTASATGPSAVSDTMPMAGTGTEPDASTVVGIAQMFTGDDSDGCNATASAGVAGRRSAGPAALGLVALMGLVLGTAAVRRRMKKRG